MNSKISLILIVLFIGAYSCKKSNKKQSSPPPQNFSEYINGFTEGHINRSETIIIKFTKPMIENESKENKLGTGILNFYPKIVGEAIWIDNSTLEFTPKEKLAWGTSYSATLNLNKITEVSEALSKFYFNFKTSQKQLTLNHSGLSLSTNKNYEIKGEIKTSDECTPEEIESIFKATQEKTTLKVFWEHQPKLFSHHFTITNIDRKTDDSEVKIQCNGEKIEIKNGDIVQLIKIPSIKQFNVSNIIVVSNPDQYIEVSFSDPINQEMDLRGLVLIDNKHVVQLRVEENILKAFPSSKLTGVHRITLNGAIQNTNGYAMNKELDQNLNFGGIKPALRLIGNGTIAPQNENLFFPFEAVNLNAVDVRITQIFNNNIHSFFQNNTYNGTYNLTRVGRIIHRSKVKLQDDRAQNTGSWKSFNLDLSELIDMETGAMYHVEIGFRKSYSLFNCESALTEDEYIPIEEEYLYPSKTYSNVYYNNYYNWRERDEPCSQAYFSPDKFIQRNILGSNFGVIAKTDQSNKTYIYVTSLLSAKPEANVTIELFDYQNQKLGSATTNARGMIDISCEREPFLIIAKRDQDIGYLKLDGNTLQQTSNFDVAGKSIKNGIKGFIYAERDVWRPGDSVHVAFILEDQKNTIPNGHPITLELHNPKGQFIKRITESKNDRFIYPFYFNTNDKDMTGKWLATVKVGAIRFTKSIRIETVKPNRLKVNLNFGEQPLSASRTTPGKLESKWLHGAPAKNLKAKIDVNFSSYAPTFKNYKQFDFSTPYNKFYGQEITIFNNSLDQEGKADLLFNFKPNNEISGFLKAQFTTKVFENGGDFSINQFSKSYSPYPNYVGMNIDWSYKNWNKLNSDENHTIQIATVNENGEPVNVSGLKVKLFELSYRWWYNNDSENLASYSGKTYHKALMEKTVASSNGMASITLPKNENRWGRHLLLATSPDGHTCGQVIYFGYSWGRQKNQKGAQMLALVTEQEKYNVGDEVTISFPANKEARALITYENGSGIIGQEWIDNLSNFTSHTFTATAEMCPNIYAHVTLIQPHGQTANDLPIRLFGITPIVVEDPNTKLHPELKMPDEVRPLKEFEVEVSEQNNEAMDYTIAIVDEGLLDLTNFKTPNPWNTFYSKEALGVKTYDLYDHVLGSFASRLESMYAIGGGASLDDNAKKKAERFKPIVKVIGPFHISKNKKAKHKITLPQYVGAVRTMVIAAEEGKYGHTDKSVAVREPLMVLATMPRVLSPNETVSLPVTVFAMKQNIKKVNVKVSCNEYLSIQGIQDTTINFEEIGEQDLFFTVKSNAKIGVAKVRIEVSAGKEKAFHEIELDIRFPNLPTTLSEFKQLNEDEVWETNLKTIGLEESNSAEIEISSMPPLNLGYRLKYLIQYPHGCLEQTTSSVFPQLYLSHLLELSENQSEEIKYYIEEAIQKIQRCQKEDGGFSYWPGGTYSNEWATTYAGHFLIEAEKAGYLVPGNMKKDFLNFIRNKAAQYTPRNSYYNYPQAYRLYLLALAGEPQISAMNRLKADKHTNNQTKWLIASAYALAGQKNAAYDLIDFRNMKSDKFEPYYYGSYIRNESLILMTLTELDETEKASELALKISKQVSSSTWYSTQSTAFALISLAHFGIKTNASKNMDFLLEVNGKQQKHNGTKPIAVFPINFKNSEASIKLSNTGESNLFINLVNKGIKSGIDKNTKEEGVKLDVMYFDNDVKIIDISKMKQGTDFIAQVTVTNTNHFKVENIALSQLFPAGWEIINSRMFGNERYKNSSFDYQDIRDDRVYTYFSLASNETKSFFIRLNASYAGTYILSPTICEAMYDNSFGAKTAGAKVSIKK